MKQRGEFIKIENNCVAVYNNETLMTDVFEHMESEKRLKKLFSVNRHLKNFDGRGNFLLCDTELYLKSGKLISSLSIKPIESSVFLRDGKIGLLATPSHNTRLDVFDTDDGTNYNRFKKFGLANHGGMRKTALSCLLENPFLPNQVFASIGREIVKFQIDRPCYELMMISDFVMRLKDPIVELKFLDSTHIILLTSLQISVMDHFSGQLLSLIDVAMGRLAPGPSISLEDCPLFINLDKSLSGLNFLDILNSGAVALIDPRYPNSDYRILGEISELNKEERVSCSEVKLLASHLGDLVVLNLSKY